MLRVLIAAGGTGGHFYPGLAVLEALRARAEVEPLFVGTARGIEARVVPGLGLPLALVDVAPLNGVRGAALARALGKLPGAALDCARTLARFRPAVVLSVGGYAAGPVTALAALAPRRRVTAVIEPNAVPGLTNRLVAPVVARAYLSYDETARYFRRRAVRVFGAPVRQAFVERARAAGDARGARAHLLAFGGSQGARALNRALPGAVALARAAGADFTVTHQTGAAERDAVAAEYAARGLEAEVVPYIEDMAGAMARADLLVCRSGAGTLAEMCVLGRPAVMVPLPTAADDHQRRNAEAVAARGAGVCLLQSALTEASLGAQLADLLGDRAGLRAMGERARALGAPDAAARVAEDLLAAAGAA